VPTGARAIDDRPAVASAGVTTDQPCHADPARDPDARARDLLDRMTLAEKIGQLALITVHRILDRNRTGGSYFQAGTLEPLLGGDSPVGGLLSGAGGAPVPNAPVEWARLTNELQRRARELSRLGVPLLYGVDAIHGHNNVLGATIYPHAIGLAASWDPQLIEAVAAEVAAGVRATGIHWNFAPNADIGVDPRWGRFVETHGEDPLIVSRMAAAAVRGLQGAGLGAGTGAGIAGPDRVAATAKHFVAYGAATGGLDRTNADVSARTLWERHLPPFEAAVRAGVATVMASSGSLNGVPVHASGYLLRELLRDRLGFDGLVVSDWGDVLFLHRDYGVAADYRDAVERSVNAGIDMSMIGFDDERFREALLALVQDGRVTVDRVDEAARRVLRLKFALGLFEQPFVDEGRVSVLSRESNAALALDAARRSMVLLVNNGVLPLRPAIRVLLCGPAAQTADWQHGGYTIGWQRVPERFAPGVPAVTVADALAAAVARGDLGDAEVAADADVILACVGEPSYAEFGGDDRYARLDPEQQQLLLDLAATGKPVVAVLIAGRPLDLGAAWDAPAALLMAHRPGTEGGTAILDLLLGRANPSGRLPYTWHRHAGQLPMGYEVLPSACDDPGAEEMRGPKYDPAFPFGAGLSYSEYVVSEAVLDRDRVSATDRLGLSVAVTNLGDDAVDCVVPVYASARHLPVMFPRQVLLDWVRITVPAGATGTARVELSLERLARCPGDVASAARPVIHPGRYELTIGKHVLPLHVLPPDVGHQRS
jgi:beta-glucosidase